MFITHESYIKFVDGVGAKGNVELKQKFLFRMEWEPIHLEEEVSKLVRRLIV